MHKIFESIILNTDSYKVSHWNQYPPGTEYVWSYIEPRAANIDVVSLGVQPFIKDYLVEPVTSDDVKYAAAFMATHGLPFNLEGWEYIVGYHGGKLPLEIRALPEGTVFRGSNAQVVVVNTDPKCFWLTSYLETALLRAVWYPSTVATVSRNLKKVIRKYADETSDDPNIDFKLHDFGARGATSQESAMLGGMAHLVNFKGTDTIAGAIGAMKWYGNVQDPGKHMPGFSIPASEHSTITSWGKDSEREAYRNMLTQYGGEGKLVACVSDSWDFMNAVDNIWGDELKKQVLETGGTLVVRPDSGNPLTMVLAALDSLGRTFGYTENSKSYKVLNPAVRVIQGDGLSPAMIEAILDSMKLWRWSTDNIAFGMGGGLLQNVNRDTFKYAMKCSAIQINGEIHDVYKDPVTDHGKKSKKGILHTHLSEDDQWNTDTNPENDQMQILYRNGVRFNTTSFESVRERALV